MAKPDYFKYFPNIEYPVKLLKSGKTESITIKDYFHLLLPRDDIFKEDTLYEQYYVKNGQRPDQISYNLYGDEQYYWIILQSINPNAKEGIDMHNIVFWDRKLYILNIR